METQSDALDFYCSSSSFRDQSVHSCSRPAVMHCGSGADWISPWEIDYNLADVEKKAE
jgi:hypothetical protein